MSKIEGDQATAVLGQLVRIAAQLDVDDLLRLLQHAARLRDSAKEAV